MIIGACMRCLLVSLMLLGAVPALAGASHGAKSLQTAADRFLAAQARSAYPGSDAEVAVGPIDDRLDLSTCHKATFFLPPGSHLWGAGTLGVECEAPSNVNLYLTYRIRLKGPALVARRPLPSNYAPTQSDLALRTIEYARDPGRYPRDPD